MIANNIFRAIGDFFTNVLFMPYEEIRSMDNWWVQNSVSWLFVVITSIAFLYWLGELKKYQKSDNEQLPEFFQKDFLIIHYLWEVKIN